MGGEQDAVVTVDVQKAGGKLDAWVDFNGDGSWHGPGEQIFDSVSVGVGVHDLTFDVPAWAASGTTFARFRLSTAGGLNVTGEAADGEVEDYQVTIAPPTESSAVFGGRTNMASAGDDADSIVVAIDVNGDGDNDVIAGDDGLYLYVNNGAGGFAAAPLFTYR